MLMSINQYLKPKQVRSVSLVAYFQQETAGKHESNLVEYRTMAWRPIWQSLVAKRILMIIHLVSQMKRKRVAISISKGTI